MAVNLNPDYLQYIQKEHPAPEQFDEFIKACQTPLTPCMRHNVSEHSTFNISSLASQRNWQLTAVPWNNSGFWVETSDERSLGNHIAHLAGHFYIQEAASMLPVMALQHGFTPYNVLDMAAAPGSKTTQLSQSLPKQHSLIANDLSASRLKMLNANMIRMGIANFALLNQDASRITANGLFDGILLDAPCGGEGTIRKDTRAWDNWSEESMASLAEVQTNLLNNAWEMLAPGGRLVYSTCTLSRVENQDVINSFLTEHQSDAELVDLSNLFSGADKASHQGMLHLWPEIYDTQGFFVAVIAKKGETESHNAGIDETTENLSTKDTALIRDYYLAHFGIELPSDIVLFEKTNKRHREIWLVPTNLSYQGMQRLQRQGVRLCQLIESRQGLQIKTHHEFCRCFGHMAKTNCLEVSAADCVDFFQGKNLMNRDTSDKSNEVILKYLGRGIGLVKALGLGKLKSQLPRELVHDNAWA